MPRSSKRITIPEGHVALILPTMLAAELEAMCRLLRKSKWPANDEARAPVVAICGDILLALLDQREDSVPLIQVTRK